MKNTLLILVCLFTHQFYGQQEVKTKSQNTKTDADGKEILAQEPTKVVIFTKSCPVEGYTVTLSRDIGSNVSSKRYLGVTGYRKSFYATAAQLAQMDNYPGVPNPGQGPTVYNGPGEYLSITNVTIDPDKKYCNEDGYRLIPANATIYKVSKGSSNYQWSGMVEITDGTNLDSADAPFLVNKYNIERGFIGTEKVPTSCLSACRNAGGGSVDPDEPGSGTTYVDASGQEHDWFDDEDNDEGGSGGIGNPVVGRKDFLYQHMHMSTGGVTNPYGDDKDNAGFVNQAHGAHLGLYLPIKSIKGVSYGVYVSGDYLASNKNDFRNNPEGYEVNGMKSTIRKSSDKSIEQSLWMFGAGPQINVGLGRKVGVSAIVQGGLTSFNQSGFAYKQDLQEGDATTTVEIINQKETNSKKFFWLPRIRLAYAITPKIGIWAEGNYMMGKAESNRSVLDPGAPEFEDGTYSYRQVNTDRKVDETNKYNLSGAGLGFGVTFSL
ncbi:hypothetical protein [Arenibacter latericius]|uniref:hypothetical protein n=1 Tax=Arenibacter latericius TaxID=86104 RepID=UPI000406AB2F|nr:hypothetical protein [Arenibacter latericius]